MAWGLFFCPYFYMIKMVHSGFSPLYQVASRCFQPACRINIHQLDFPQLAVCGGQWSFILTRRKLHDLELAKYVRLDNQRALGIWAVKFFQGSWRFTFFLLPTIQAQGWVWNEYLVSSYWLNTSPYSVADEVAWIKSRKASKMLCLSMKWASAVWMYCRGPEASLSQRTPVVSRLIERPWLLNTWQHF